MGFLEWLLPGAATAESPDIAAGVAEFTQTVDARLTALPGLDRALAPAVGSALAFCRETLAAIPGPLDACLGRWRQSPALEALFASGEEVRDVLSHQEAAQSFLTEHPAEPELFALFWARLEEKKGFVLRQDAQGVPYESAAVSLHFSRHRLLLPRCSARELAHDLFWGLFRQLAREVARALQETRDAQTARHEEIAWLRANLRARQPRGALRDAAQIKMEERLAALSAQTSPVTLEDTLKEGIRLLSAPEKLLAVAPLEFRVNRANHLVGAGEEGRVTRFCHFRVRTPEPREGVLLQIRCPTKELLSREFLQKDIERLFG
ncbi:MAG: hypothetical protein LBG69_05075 [Zoogloeaceae bacterium]|jgi:hypothetical protein|nr:hypothetical protein [Zoogloeaceae bacterium]